MQETENKELDFGESITKIFKESYKKREKEIEFLCKFGSPLQRAKATLIRDVVLGSSGLS